MAAGSTPKKTTRPAKPAGPPTAPATTSPAKVKKIQVVAVVDPEMVAALDAFAEARGVNRSEAVRQFLHYGRTAAERWQGASAPAKKTSVPARAPRSGIQRSA